MEEPPTKENTTQNKTKQNRIRKTAADKTKRLMENNNSNYNNEEEERKEQEEALVALIEHRTKEVDQLKKRLSYYTAQVEEAEKRLSDTETKLARLRAQGKRSSSTKNSTNDGLRNVKVERRSASPNGMRCVKVERRSASPVPIDRPRSKPELVIPSVNPKTSQPASLARAQTVSASQPNTSVSTPSSDDRRPERKEIQSRGTKRKLDEKEHTELIPLIGRSSSPRLIRCHTSNVISCKHKRKLRSLALCPVDDQLFATSALDGLINIWQIKSKGSTASVLGSHDCITPKHRKWPEDVAWHPQGHSLFSVYSADAGDSQISVLDLNKGQGRTKVSFLDDKPHVKGNINSIEFMPWDEACFVTGGSDHAVVLWSEKDNSWKPKTLHRSMHSSAVMGVSGMQHKSIVLSAGADKRIIGYDVQVGRADYRHQIESKCMSVLANPCDFNLFMVHTGTHGKQLRLFDIRLRQTEIHSFGWKQESSELQSALINQAWSPDGLYLSSGTADPMIHIFDIRYKAHEPCQSIKAHQKRVFKAVWLQSLPLLVSISSDLNIGLHKI